MFGAQRIAAASFARHYKEGEVDGGAKKSGIIGLRRGKNWLLFWCAAGSKSGLSWRAGAAFYFAGAGWLLRHDGYAKTGYYFYVK